MVFRICATLDATRAQALWSSDTVNVAVVSGAFATDLGDNSTSPPQLVLSPSIFSDDTRYLGIAVNGQELVPRKRLASVSYAMSGGVQKCQAIHLHKTNTGIRQETLMPIQEVQWYVWVAIDLDMLKGSLNMLHSPAKTLVAELLTTTGQRNCRGVRLKTFYHHTMHSASL
jgi:hypothetical protein